MKFRSKKVQTPLIGTATMDQRSANTVRNWLSLLVRRISGWLGMVTDGWERFWFERRDPTVLGIMRWLVGGMLVYTHAVWGLNLPAFIGAAGWNSTDVLQIVQEGRIVPSFWWYVPEHWMLSVHCVCMVVLVCFWVGLLTRMTSVLSLIITISYAYRAHMANFGLDQINGILCFYLCIGPSGAALSVDRWLRHRKAVRRNSQQLDTARFRAVQPSVSANLAVRLIQVHFCVIYTFAGLSKLQGFSWWSGESVWLAFANLEYQSMDMTWIAWYPWIGELMTHSTIIWEVSFAALIWVRPARPWVLAIGFLMHFGIGAAMGMWTFGLVMIFGHVAFWPSEMIAAVTALRPFQPTHRHLESAPKAVTVSSAGLAKEPETVSRQPALLCIDSLVSRRLSCMGYFLSRGFRCLTTDDPREADLVQSATAPDAVVVMGTQMPDAELEALHDNHFSKPNSPPLFMLLTERQSARMNGHIHTPQNRILTGAVSLGRLRREIQETLGLPPSATVVAKKLSAEESRESVFESLPSKG